jgi:hypothetical protein
MRKRILILVAILGVLGIVAFLMVLGFVLADPMQTGAGGGGFSAGKCNVQYVTFGANQRTALVILTDATGTSGSEAESGLFIRSCAKGFVTSAEGKRIEWEWIAPRDKGGDFSLDGAAYDLTDGTLFLVATKGGQVRVTQLDVDLSKFPTIPTMRDALPQPPRIDAAGRDKLSTAIKDWAKDHPRVAQFLAEAEAHK